MTREEAIKILSQYDVSKIKFYWTDGRPIPWQDATDAIEMGIEALEAQEPVEPTEPDEDNTRYCGACGSPVGYEVLGAAGLDYIQYSYCPICGRPVKWE